MKSSSEPKLREKSVWLAMLRLSGLIVAACMVVSLLQPGKANAGGLKGMAVITVSRVALRQSASTRGRVVTSVSKGEIVKILSARGDWYNVTTSGGWIGWCQSRNLSGAANTSTFKPGNAAKLDWPSEYINLAQTFTYPRCMQDMNEIAAAYGDAARIETIGTTTMGNPINAIVIGNPDAQIRILVQAAIHARESLSALLALRQAECILKAASLDGSYKGVSVKKLLNNVEIWVVPEANPDGVRLVFEGLAAVPASMPELAASIKAMNKGSAVFSRWKANARGVDLNRNFEGGWKVDPNYRTPGPFNYSGPHAFSEPESIALRDLSVAKDFALTMSYHTSGEMIYWYNPKGGNDLNLHIANQVKALSGYAVLSASSQALGGGYRDWFVNTYSRPGMTMEIGSGYTPLPQSQFGAYWKDTRFVMLEMLWTVAPKSLGSYAN